MRRSDREIIDNDKIEEIIKKADVCRLAMIDGDMPYIVTLNFGYIKNDSFTFYFHCANKGRKLDIISKNNTVCFQLDVDHELINAKKACGYTMNFKSVVGYGKVCKVESKEEKTQGLNCIMKQYSERDNFDYEDKMLDITTILKLEVNQINGKIKE